MTEPLHHGFDALYPRSLREPRPRDHDDGKVERACGVDGAADLIERQRESASAVRAEHERLTTELHARIYALETEVAALRFPEGKAS